MRMFNVPNLFTASNMLCGVIAIILSLLGRIDLAPYFIFLGAVLDFFDGFLARLLKQQGELGKQLDSLADMITFGLAPGIFMFVFLVFQTLPEEQFLALGMYSGDLLEPVDYVRFAWLQWAEELLNWRDFSWLPFTALLIPVFSMFRLAKFNIDTRQSESFIGLPTPANTIFFTAFPLLLARSADMGGLELGIFHSFTQPWVVVAIIAVMSFMLIAELPLFALKFKSFAWKGNELRYGFLISCGILIPWLQFWSMPIIVLLYLLLSIINNVRRGAQKTNA